MLKSISAILSGLIFFLYFSSIQTSVKAHTRNDWLLVNDEVALVENTDPTPYNLEVREHNLAFPIIPGSTLNFKILPSVLLLSDEIQISARLSDGQKFSGTDFSIHFLNSGSFFLDITFNYPGDTRSVWDEGISIVVGDKHDALSILFNNKKVDLRSSLQIERSVEQIFTIAEPQVGYTYFWDVGTEVVQGEILRHTFSDQKMPFYLVVRSLSSITNVYVDSYVRLTSEEAQSYQVLEPHVAFPENEQNLSNTQTLQNIAFFSIIIIIASVTALFYFLKKRDA